MNARGSMYFGDAIRLSLVNDGWYSLYAPNGTDIAHGDNWVTIRLTDDLYRLEVWFPPHDPPGLSAKASVYGLRQIPGVSVDDHSLDPFHWMDRHGYRMATVDLATMDTPKKTVGFNLYGDPLI